MRKNLPSSEALLVAIRAKCMDCSGNQRREVERCKLTDCPLHPFRSVRVLGGEHERQTEINGRIDLFDILMAAAILPNDKDSLQEKNAL